VIKRSGRAADPCRVVETICRICGERWADDEYVEVGTGCARCGGDPLCDGCGHQRTSHTSGCTETDYDFETLTGEPCPCPAYT
jgi:hypothetical protein